MGLVGVGGGGSGVKFFFFLKQINVYSWGSVIFAWL